MLFAASNEALPDHEDSPPQCCDGLSCRLVALPVVLQLPLPEIPTSAWYLRQIAVKVSMPEAAIDENRHLPAGKNYVWRTGQIFAMQTVSVPYCKKRLAHPHLRFCVLPADASHHLTAFSR